MRRSIATVTVIALTLAAAGCGKNAPGLVGQIKVDGSSTVYPLSTAVADDFRVANPGLKISVAISGTGGGFEKFCRGETDLQNASRPIDASERTACESRGVRFIEVPVAYDALTLIVHPANDWASSMTLAELKKLWEPAAQGTITKWSDIRASWPGEPIRLFGPGPASGTFDYFTEAVVGTTRASRTDYTASEDDTVIVKGVAADRHALGYVGYGYFSQNRATLGAVAVDSERGEVRLGAVAPSPESVRRGVYQPLSRTLFIYINAASAERPEVLAFVNFYLKQDEALVERVGGIAMSSRTYELVRQRVAQRTVGTLFADRALLGRNLELVLAEAQR